MCGISGIFAYSNSTSPVNRLELMRICEHMTPRGPDSAGLWVSDDQRVGLAHRRLAIIDLTGDGDQPMATADGRYQIVFNGEIYNFLELKAELKTKGAIFKSNSDTEVLLLLYSHYGEMMCRKLRGMFAFSIWDTQEKSLFLARDPFGIKPLYLADNGQTLRFASQVKALLSGGNVSLSIDQQAEKNYWTWGHVPEPRTLFADIRAFKPGTWLKISQNAAMQVGLFDSVVDMLQGDTPPIKPYNDLRAALLDSVQHHLIADVPVGVFLSSGIDSCTLAALTAECGGTLRTLTLGFEEYRGTPLDETQMAEQVAKQLGAQHHSIWMSKKDFATTFDQFMQAVDQPSIDGLNIWLVSKASAQVGLKVAISGLGGDEIFGGYPSFKQLPRIRRIAKPFALIPGLSKMLRQLSAPLLSRFTSPKYASLFEYGTTLEDAYLLRRALRMPWEVIDSSSQAQRGISGSSTPTREDVRSSSSAFSGSYSDFAQISLLETTLYMRNQLLRDSDWASMAHSIELRMPLVDTEVIRYVSQQRKQGNILTKQDLAACARPLLPQAITQRKKTGFTLPIRDWIQPDGQAMAEPSARGLRGWQETVYKRYLKETSSIPLQPKNNK